MYRRRPPRRRPVPRRPPPRPGKAALQMLRRANRLMERGQYEQAYPLLKRLADGAARRGMPVRAASLTLRAARARLEMGSAVDAASLARQAIQLLIAAGQGERVRGMVPRLIGQLEAKGFHDQAIALRAEVAVLLSGSATASPATQRGTLPGKCPSCNGPVRADEVAWIDDRSAECPFCGSTIHAEQAL